MPLALLAALAFCAAPAPARPPPDGTTLKLKPGAERVLKVPGLARIAVGDPEVADVRPKGSAEVGVRGLAEGRTEVLVWDAKGNRFRYPVVVCDPKTAPGNAQTQALDRVVSSSSAGTVEDVAMDLTVGEEKSAVYSDVSKVAVTQASPTVEVAPLDSGDGVRIKGVAVGTAKVLLHLGGRPAVALAVTVLDAPAKGAAPGAGGPAQPRFGGRALPKPDCTGDTTTPETARMVAEAVDLERARKHASALEKLLAVVEKQPGAAHVYKKLGALYAKTGELDRGAAAYETFVLSCPAQPDTKKVRALLEDFRKSRAR
jgi:pilus assembly protein CpaC